MSSYLTSLVEKSKSFYQAMNLDTSNHSILITWLQNRLREHYLLTNARELQARESKDYATTPKIDKFDVVCHELKVLDAEVNHSGDDTEDWDKFMDIMMGIDPSSRPPRSEHQVYRVGRSRISLTYKADPYRTVETLHLIAEVGQIDDVTAVEVHGYYPRAEKHKIDVHVKIFPVLESWITSRDVKKIQLPIPKCYFGKSETSKKVHVDALHEFLSTDERDIMSKVSSAMALEHSIPPPTVESHRMLLLQDIEQEKFESRTSDKSKFIPFLNVEAALRELAVIHCVSWALAEIEQKSLRQMWPFLSSTSKFCSLVIDRGQVTLPKLTQEMEQHLEHIQAPDKEEILSAIRKLNISLEDTLHNSMKFAKKGPICLIHQCLSSSAVLFRHTLLSNPDISLYENSIASNSSELVQTEEDIKSKRPVTANERRVTFDVTAMKNTKKKARSSTNTPRATKLPRLVSREVRLVEWQNASYGSPMIDAAFLILTSLPPEIRKYHTDELLDVYWASFEETSRDFNLKGNWTKDGGDKSRSYLSGLLFASIILMTKTFPEIIPGNPEEHLEVVREAVRELIKHKLL